MKSVVEGKSVALAGRGSTKERDQTCAIVVTIATAVTMLDP